MARHRRFEDSAPVGVGPGRNRLSVFEPVKSTAIRTREVIPSRPIRSGIEVTRPEPTEDRFRFRR